ncbi:membrane protein insertase YidC [Chrysiogenes arsenatis]|uniref:membrane protein insertase YidC n=1 Tax=Chrysiogenes arsenatis TaxID=309797 RepID=UPI00041F35C7|nr:membrane protein insertase YidC [Chrysiogenes arsenatis]
MDKKMILALVLSIIVLIGWQILIVEPQFEEHQRQLAQSQAAEAANMPAAEEVPMANIPSTTLPATPSAVPMEMAATMAADEFVVFETDGARLTFSLAGAAVTSIQLTEHLADGTGGELVEMLHPRQAAFTTLVAGHLSSMNLERQRFEVVGRSADAIAFQTILPDGAILQKTYHFPRLSEMKIQYRVEGESASGLLSTITTLPSAVITNVKTDTFSYAGMVHKTLDSGLQKVGSYEDVKAIQDIPNAQFAGTMDKFFLLAFLPQQGEVFRIFPGNTVQAGGLITSIDRDVIVFYGPKEKSLLQRYAGLEMDKSIDYGWFGFIAAPLMSLIHWFYALTGNYGVAIILLTVVIKIVFFPLTHKSYKAMKKISKLQPEMKKLREKFKNDPQKMNAAVMELYKTNKANPMSGCLPILVQIPVFFALYQSLLNAIELRHAPFALWIQDLSAADPYYITPVIMGATMFLQQKLTPSAMDPTQQKIMLALPVVFTFLFFGFPAGLILYWIVNNVLSIAQQYYINKKAD